MANATFTDTMEIDYECSSPQFMEDTTSTNQPDLFGCLPDSALLDFPLPNLAVRLSECSSSKRTYMGPILSHLRLRKKSTIEFSSYPSNVASMPEWLQKIALNSTKTLTGDGQSTTTSGSKPPVPSALDLSQQSMPSVQPEKQENSMIVYSPPSSPIPTGSTPTTLGESLYPWNSATPARKSSWRDAKEIPRSSSVKTQPKSVASRLIEMIQESRSTETRGTTSLETPGEFVQLKGRLWLPAHQYQYLNRPNKLKPPALHCPELHLDLLEFTGIPPTGTPAKDLTQVLAPTRPSDLTAEDFRDYAWDYSDSDDDPHWDL